MPNGTKRPGIVDNVKTLLVFFSSFPGGAVFEKLWKMEMLKIYEHSEAGRDFFEDYQYGNQKAY